MRSMMEMVLGARLTFSERLDPEVLARATRLLLDLEPVLGCWWDESPLGAAWVRCAETDAGSAFSMAVSDDPDRDAATFHATPFDPKGPRLAVLLLRGADRDDLCVRFDHVVGDGWSAKEVTHLLAETYTRLLEDPSYRPVPRTSSRPDHDDVWSALTDEQREMAADPPKMQFSRWSIKTRPAKGNAFAVRTLTIAPERVEAIRQYAHTRGGTVNDAVVAAAVRSAAAICPPRDGVKPAVSISADTRRFAPDAGLERLVNLATTQNVLLDYVHGEGADETLQHVIDGVKPYKDCLWTVGASRGAVTPPPVVWRVMFAVLAMTMRAFHSGSLVTMNVGPFDEDRLVFGGVRPVAAVATGPLIRAAGFPALLSYYRGALTLWIGFRHRYIAPEFVERYLAGIDTELAALSAS